MRYFVISDPHGFYTLTRRALAEQGFFDDPHHKLILCGDMMDRGNEAVEMQQFMLELLAQERLIFVRGNHEDLMQAMLFDIACARPVSEIHQMNGTWGTALQLCGLDKETAERHPEEVARRVMETDFYRHLLPAAADYFETNHFVFVHGWLPAYTVYPDTEPEEAALRCRPDWRDATYKEWCAARWHNGMERCCLDRYGIPDKTVVCGHWHTSFGHARISKKGSEYGADACFAPFRAEGILALDACTARSGLINCVVLED